MLINATHRHLTVSDRNGTKAVPMKDGSSRTFLENGDTVMMTGVAVTEDGTRVVGFGECVGQVLPPACGRAAVY